jgi:hypothetical protein
VLDREAAGDLGEEAGELRRLPQLAPPQLGQDGAEGVLEEVLRLGPAVGVAVEKDRDAAAIELDDPLLRAPVPCLDAGDQRFQVVAGVERCLVVPGQKPFPRCFEDAADSSTRAGSS